MQTAPQQYYVEINAHEIVDKRVFYIIVIKNLVGKSEKVSKKRFSEIEIMHNKIIDWINIFKIKIPLPQLPKKKLLFSTNQSEEAILKRRKELQQYFNEILAHQELHCLDVIEAMLPTQMKSEKRQSDKSSTTKETKDTRWNEIALLKQSYLAKHESSPVSQFSMPTLKNEPKKQQFFFKFEEHYVMDDYLVYSILITDAFANRSWKFNQRYKDLKEYHRLVKKSKKYEFELPEFPEKKIVCNLVDDELSQRKQQLEAYLNKIFSYPEIAESEIMVFFISKSQIDGNEIGCRSKGPSQQTLENSSLKVQSQSQLQELDEVDEKEIKRKITC